MKVVGLAKFLEHPADDRGARRCGMIERELRHRSFLFPDQHLNRGCGVKMMAIAHLVASMASKRPAKTKTSAKRWSQDVSEHSNALDLEKGVFTLKNPKKIAVSLKCSAEASHRRKADPYRSAMSMLVFYINRAGKGLSQADRARLEKAKDELRKDPRQGAVQGESRLTLLGLGPAFHLADPMLGMLYERRKHGVEGRLLGRFIAAVGLKIGEDLPVIGIAFHLLPAMPEEIADEEELDPGEQTVGPVFEVIAKVDAGSAEIEVGAAQRFSAARQAVLLGGDLDQPAVKKRMLGTFEEDEAHAVSAWIEPARVEQLEVEAPQLRGYRIAISGGVFASASSTRLAPASRAVANEGFRVRADEARDENFA